MLKFMQKGESMNYLSLTKEELTNYLAQERRNYDAIVAEGNKVDIARGKPCNEQLDIAMPMLDMAEQLKAMMKMRRIFKISAGFNGEIIGRQ